MVQIVERKWSERKRCEMKIFGGSNAQVFADDSVVTFDADKARWTVDDTETVGMLSRFTADVDEMEVDWIGSRHVRQSGGWSQEIVLFPGLKLDISPVT
jgi:hypothetical protein